MKDTDKKNTREFSETEDMKKDKKEKFEIAAFLLTRTSSIEWIEEFTGLTREEIFANLQPEEIKRFNENKITDKEEEEAVAAWEKWQAYELRLKPERDFMNCMESAKAEGFVQGFVKEYTKAFPQAEQDDAKIMAAKELKSEGYAIELIKKYTGVTGEEIQKWESE